MDGAAERHRLMVAEPSIEISVSALPALLEEVARSRRLPCPATDSLRLRYLRRKPGRGMVAVFDAGEGGAAQRWCLTMREADSTQSATPDADGITLHGFPDDPAMPALAACVDPPPGGEVFAALQSAARIQLADPSAVVTRIASDVIRYKPASRCVLRYRLGIAHAQNRGVGGDLMEMTVFAKAYADARDARSVHAALETLWRSPVPATPVPACRLVPRPLGVVDSCGLVISEAVGCSHDTVEAAGPVASAAAAGSALARLQLADVGGLELAGRGPADEARRVRARVAVLQAHAPAAAAALADLGATLIDALSSAEPAAPRPCHGSFKPSQLLVTSAGAVLTDLDGVCVADPAVDVGSFLAYLRAPGFWKSRQTARLRYRRAAHAFVDAYEDAMSGAGVPTADVIRRAGLFEAASLLKIATRRVHRLNSPRLQELRAVVAEARACVVSSSESIAS